MYDQDDSWGARWSDRHPQAYIRLWWAGWISVIVATAWCLLGPSLVFFMDWSVGTRLPQALVTLASTPTWLLGQVGALDIPGLSLPARIHFWFGAHTWDHGLAYFVAYALGGAAFFMVATYRLYHWPFNVFCGLFFLVGNVTFTDIASHLYMKRALDYPQETRVHEASLAKAGALALDWSTMGADFELHGIERRAP